jgi:hypothetical protein
MDVEAIHIPARVKGLNIEIQDIYKKLVFHNHKPYLNWTFLVKF